MDPVIGKIPGGISLDGLELKNGKCGCTSVLPCCFSWSKFKRTGSTIQFTVKTTAPDTLDNYSWGYTVRKGDITLEVKVDDARDKKIFSGFFPPRIEEFVAQGWDVVGTTGTREDAGLWRCAACKWLYKEAAEAVKFEDLPADWKCPVCKAGKDVFEKAG
jgi:rubredoxin